MDGTDQVSVLIGACLCPGAPHEDGDVVYLMPLLDLRGGMKVQQTIIECVKDSPISDIEIAIRLREVFVIAGVTGWTLIDDDGPLPVTEETVRKHLLNDFSRAHAVAERADALYSERVVTPFVTTLSKLSQATSTNGSTSATRSPSRKRRKQSKPSSITTIPTDDTETTSGSPVGVSSF